jgi:hypothetical protein
VGLLPDLAVSILVAPLPVSILVLVVPVPIAISVLVASIPIDVNVSVAVDVDVLVVLRPDLDDLDLIAFLFAAGGQPPANGRPQHHRPCY